MIFPIPAGTHWNICGYWGDPRGGGARSHQGVDLCCAFGTPLLACADGRVSYGPDPLGGNTVDVYPSDGSHYYYAHLSRYEGGNRFVKAGDIIGYCGHSGDAQANLPHLHFGHYVGGVAVNPLPELQSATHVAANGQSTKTALLTGLAILGLSGVVVYLVDHE